MRKYFLASMMLSVLLMLGGTRAWAQSGDTEIIATVDDDGVGTPRIESKKTDGPLQVASQMAGQWYNTTSSEVGVQVKVTNPTAVPLVLGEIRATFKKGARRTDPTIDVVRAPGFTLYPGESRTVMLRYVNPDRQQRVSAIVAVPYHSGSNAYVQEGFLAGTTQYRIYGRYSKGFSGLLPAPDSLANYPITAGPLYPWPSPYDVQLNPNPNSLVQFGF